jgi:hypothetical protein
MPFVPSMKHGDLYAYSVVTVVRTNVWRHGPSNGSDAVASPVVLARNNNLADTLGRFQGKRMYGSLFWIEWLDRLDRVLTSTRQDVAALNRAVSPRRLAALERSRRQLAALTNDLRLLDRDVLPPSADVAKPDRADHLQKALDTALFRLDSLAEVQAQTAPAIPDRVLSAIDAALRDSRYEAAMLLEPSRRRA